MITMLFKHKAMTAALLSVLTLTACGQQKSNYNGTPMDAKKIKTADTGGSLGGGLPAPAQSSKSSTSSSSNGADEPPLPEPVPEKVTTSAPAGVAPSTQKSVQSAPVRQTSQKSEKPSATVSADKSPALSSSKKGTGATKGDLIYTTASTDDLISSLRARAEKATRAERSLNAETASSIVSAKLSVRDSGEAVITLKMSEGSSIKTYNVVGDLSEGHSSALQAVSEVEGSRTTGAKVVAGSLKCLDEDGGCDNTLARLSVDSRGSKAIVNIVFRKTIADSYFKLPGRESGDPEYAQIEDFIKNSILSTPGDDRIEVVRMNTFEVVNGRSGFSLTIEGMNKEFMGFEGPLLGSTESSFVNIPLNRIGAGEASGLRFDLDNTLGEVRLAGNNGQGKLTLSFKMRPNGNYTQDEFVGIFTRRIKPIINPTEEN